MGARVGVACQQRLVHKCSKFFAGEFFVNLFDLRGKEIPAGPAFADEAPYLRVALQCRPNGLDLSLWFFGRPFSHNRPDLFA